MIATVLLRLAPSVVDDWQSRVPDATIGDMLTLEPE
jgi:hypothetical protein